METLPCALQSVNCVSIECLLGTRPSVTLGPLLSAGTLDPQAACLGTEVDEARCQPIPSPRRGAHNQQAEMQRPSPDPQPAAAAPQTDDVGDARSPRSFLSGAANHVVSLAYCPGMPGHGGRQGKFCTLPRNAWARRSTRQVLRTAPECDHLAGDGLVPRAGSPPGGYPLGGASAAMRAGECGPEPV